MTRKGTRYVSTPLLFAIVTASILLRSVSASELLLSGSVASGQIGPRTGGLYVIAYDWRVVAPSLGVGFNIDKDVGVLLSLRSAEGWLTGAPGDYMFSLNYASPYLYVTKGLQREPKGERRFPPVFYGFVGGNPWQLGYPGYPYAQAGVGVKWTYYAVSPSFEVCGQYAGAPDGGLALKLEFGLELGGWWPVTRGETETEE